jgi:hypothetical protein
MAALQPPTNPTPGTPNAVQGPDGRMWFFDANNCWYFRVGGSPAWRNNNPYNIKPQIGDGNIGHEGDIATYPSNDHATSIALTLLTRYPHRSLMENLNLYNRDDGGNNDPNCYFPKIRELATAWGWISPTDLSGKVEEMSQAQLAQVLGAIASCVDQSVGTQSATTCPPGSQPVGH